MSKFKIECFDQESELIAFEGDGEMCPIFEFPCEIEGYISLGNLTSKIKGKSCIIDVRQLDDGEYLPTLILPDKTITLPRLKKEYGVVYPIEPGVSDIAPISLRERRLCQRVEILESQMREISKKVFGSRLFELP